MTPRASTQVKKTYKTVIFTIFNKSKVFNLLQNKLYNSHDKQKTELDNIH